MNGNKCLYSIFIILTGGNFRMSKRTKRWLSIVTTLAVAFVMTFGCMGEVFAVEGQNDTEQPASVEQTEPAAPAGEAAAEPAEDPAVILVLSQGFKTIPV